MAEIKVAHAAVAAGNFLWMLAGQAGLPPIVGAGVELWDRLSSLTKAGRRNAEVKRAIQGALAKPDYQGADEADVVAADQAVARVLVGVPADQKLIAAARDEAKLHDLLVTRARAERKALISEPAQAVFDLILVATESYLVKSAMESDDFVQLAHREELRDLADMTEEIRGLFAQLSQIPAETMRLLAGPVLTLSPPVVPKGYPIQPSRLLAPTSGVFPFVDRGDLLERLVSWVDDPVPFGVHIVGGKGGSGKSRLAVELCRQLADRGGYWNAGFLGAGASTAVLAALTGMPGGRLVVLDYAEMRALNVAAVLTELSASATWLQPVRVLLLVRNPAPSPTRKHELSAGAELWKAAVRAPGDEAASALLDDAGITLLTADSLTLHDRERLFTAAVDRLPVYVEPPTVGQPKEADLGFLTRSEFEQPLYVAMAAYLCVAGEHVVANGPQALFDGCLQHEARYWAHTASLPAIQLALTEPELRLLVALATLTDVAGEDEALQLLATVDFLRGDVNALLRARAGRWLKELYPPLQGGHWGQLLPDRLGEYVVAQQLAGRPAMIHAALSADRAADQLLRPLRTLARACAEHTGLASRVGEVFDEALVRLNNLAWELASTPDPWESATFIEGVAGLVEVIGRRCMPENLIAASRLLGQRNRLTAPLALALDRAALDATQAGSEPAMRAEALSNYAIRLAETGHSKDALAPAREAVEAYRALDGSTSAAYAPGLARSLNNYAIRLAGTGHPEDALAPAREAVEGYRALVKVDPAEYGPDLAAALNNYANMLAEAGRREDALAPIREAIDAYRVLVQSDSDAYTPALATSLNNLAAVLAGAGHAEGALAPAREAVELRRALAQAKPAVYTPDLAMSLNNYSAVMARAGQAEGALAPAQEAVDLYRELAQANPAVFTPAFVMSSNNYAVRLDQAGRRD